MLIACCAPKKYSLRQDEEIFGTWVSQVSNPQKLVMMPDGTWEEYIYQTDSSPAYKGTYEVTERWNDAQGNTWYKEVVSCTFGLGKGSRTQELDRINKSRQVWELVYVEIGQFDRRNFPKVIDPKDSSYRIYERLVK